jgi:hypothetical protein
VPCAGDGSLLVAAEGPPSKGGASDIRTVNLANYRCNVALTQKVVPDFCLTLFCPTPRVAKMRHGFCVRRRHFTRIGQPAIGRLWGPCACQEPHRPPTLAIARPERGLGPSGLEAKTGKLLISRVALTQFSFSSQAGVFFGVAHFCVNI